MTDNEDARTKSDNGRHDRTRVVMRRWDEGGLTSISGVSLSSTVSPLSTVKQNAGQCNASSKSVGRVVAAVMSKSIEDGHRASVGDKSTTMPRGTETCAMARAHFACVGVQQRVCVCSSTHPSRRCFDFFDLPRSSQPRPSAMSRNRLAHLPPLSRLYAAISAQTRVV